MRRPLDTPSMSTRAIATLLSFTPCTGAAANAAVTVEDSGCGIYLHDVQSARSRRGEARLGPRSSRTLRSQSQVLVCRSPTERCAVPVAGAKVQAASSGAADLDPYLERPVGFQNSSPLSGFSKKEMDEVIDKAASRHSVGPNQPGWLRARRLVEAESNFHSRAIAGRGAVAPMRLVPNRAADEASAGAGRGGAEPARPALHQRHGVRPRQQKLLTQNRPTGFAEGARTAGFGRDRKHRNGTLKDGHTVFEILNLSGTLT